MYLQVYNFLRRYICKSWLTLITETCEDMSLGVSYSFEHQAVFNPRQTTYL